MKLLSFERPGSGAATWGLMVGDGVVDLGGLAPSLRDALAAQMIDTLPASGRADYLLDDITYLPVIPEPQKIICVAGNYEAHLREAGFKTPPKPRLFPRFANSQVGHMQPIVRPLASVQLDYEGELAVVIGRKARHVGRDKAMQCVAGYSCYNDGSIRDWQSHSTQYTAGKNFPLTGAFGPWMVTPDEMGDLRAATLATRLNGVEVQRTSVGDMVLDVPALIEYCSSFTELLPGDVIVSGTPAGVGLFHTPPLWMKAGDTVEVEISGIGILRNSIVDEAR